MIVWDTNTHMHARTHTEVMWLGSYQQLKQVDIDDIPILSMQVKVAETARDLGVVLDSQL